MTVLLNIDIVYEQLKLASILFDSVSPCSKDHTRTRELLHDSLLGKSTIDDPFYRRINGKYLLHLEHLRCHEEIMDDKELGACLRVLYAHAKMLRM